MRLILILALVLMCGTCEAGDWKNTEIKVFGGIVIVSFELNGHKYLAVDRAGIIHAEDCPCKEKPKIKECDCPEFSNPKVIYQDCGNHGGEK